MKIAVIIPSYNAEKTLAKVIETLPAKIRQKDYAGIYIVNDASQDNTQKVAENLTKQNPNVTVIKHPQNRGYGGALKSGLRAALDEGYQVMPVIHSDGQYAPELALKLCQPIIDGKAEIVQGSRMLGGAREGEKPMPMTRYLPNRILTEIENLVFGTKMAEFHSGYMVYSASLLHKIPFEKLQENYNFDGEMIVMAKLVDCDCWQEAIPTKYDDDSSSLNPIPYGLNVLKMCLRFELGGYRKLLDDFEAEQNA